MAPLMRLTVGLFVVVFISTSFYVYDISKECLIVNVYNVSDVADKGTYMCNVAVAVYTTPGHAYTRVADAKKSWTKRICTSGTPQYMFIGLPSTMNIPDSVDVPCGTDYYSLCCKSMEGLALLYHKFPNADWYYKADDDTMLVPHNVDALLAKYDSNDKLLLGYAIEAGINSTTKEFEGKIYVPSAPHRNGELFSNKIMYCSGSGYVMSGGLVRGMMTNMTHYKEVWDPICEKYDPEDVAVGLFAAIFGARVEHINGVYNKGWNWEEGPSDNDYEIVSIHLSRDTQKMVLLDRIISGVPPKRT